MKIGTVMGTVDLSRCAPGYEQIGWFQVRLEDRMLVAADMTGVQPGDLVLIALGCAADGYRQDLRCDALIVGKLDNQK